MTKGPVRLDVAVSYALPRTGLPAAASFRKWVAAALKGRIREADRAIRVVDAKEGQSDVKLSQLMQHCLMMADRYRPVAFA